MHEKINDFKTHFEDRHHIPFSPQTMSKLFCFHGLPRIYCKNILLRQYPVSRFSKLKVKT
jgi:hypothetical protein